MAKPNGRRTDRRGRSEGAPPFVQIPWWLMETPAFHSLTSDSKAALLYVTKRFNGHNNGKIGFSVREGGFVRNPGQPDAQAHDYPLFSKTRMHRALSELQAFGFAVVAQESSFGQKRLAREWRLTWLPCDGKAPTKDFVALTWADCASIAAAQKTKRSPAGGTMPPATVPLAGHGEGSKGANMPLQSRSRDYEAVSLSRRQDTSSNHIQGDSLGGGI